MRERGGGAVRAKEKDDDDGDGCSEQVGELVADEEGEDKLNFGIQGCLATAVGLLLRRKRRRRAASTSRARSSSAVSSASNLAGARRPKSRRGSSLGTIDFTHRARALEV